MPQPHTARASRLFALTLAVALPTGCVQEASTPSGAVAHSAQEAPSVQAGAPAPAAAPVRAAPKAPRITTSTAPAKGFDDRIVWRGLEEGLEEARDAGAPLMLVVHASWCAACKALKPSFSNPEIVDLSRKFVMVNADQDEVPAALMYAPDGSYLPRVLFIDPTTGEVNTDLRNTMRGQHRYFYTPHDDLAGMMKSALTKLGSAS